MMPYRDPTWGPASRLAGLVVVMSLAWAAVPSSLFMRPINMAVIKDDEGRWIMVSERETPFGSVSVTTLAEIQVLGREDGLTCAATLSSLVVPKPNNISRYDITSWAEPCMQAGPPIGVTFERTVHLGGVLPLRPVHYSFTINPEAAPVVSGEGK